jgi:2-polyprenyl-3-methyl-5-hydroxy-6-metoxy-1,4-benzoquinol methylase
MHRDRIVSEFSRQAESFNTSEAARAAATLDGLLALTAARPEERWLDAACGPGVISRALAPLVGHVEGVDATLAMIAVARREAAAAGLANTTFTVGDVTALTVPEGSFDAAINRFAIHHVPVPGRMVAELARVVRPGGRIVLSDTVADADARTCGWAQAIERLRDPSHWASLPLEQLRALGTAAGLTLADERLTTLEIDFDDWLAPGLGTRERAPRRAGARRTARPQRLLRRHAGRRRPATPPSPGVALKLAALTAGVAGGARRRRRAA